MNQSIIYEAVYLQKHIWVRVRKLLLKEIKKYIKTRTVILIQYSKSILQKSNMRFKFWIHMHI